MDPTPATYTWKLKHKHKRKHHQHITTTITTTDPLGYRPPMSSFSAKTRAESVVLAPQQDIWDVLVDPELMARFTPFLESITADGDHWRWQLSGLNVLGAKVAPAFTERMQFTEPDRIEFRHDPPAGTTEQAGVEGWYALTPHRRRNRSWSPSWRSPSTCRCRRHRDRRCAQPCAR